MQVGIYEVGLEAHKSKHEAQRPQNATGSRLPFPGVAISGFLVHVKDDWNDGQDQPQDYQKGTHEFEPSGFLAQEEKPTRRDKREIVSRLRRGRRNTKRIYCHNIDHGQWQQTWMIQHNEYFLQEGVLLY